MENRGNIVQYVLIGFGYTETFEAATRYEAIGIAHRIAAAQRLLAWLLYDDSAHLIAEG